MQVDKPAKPTLIRQKKGKIKAKSQFFRTARYGLTLQEHRIVSVSYTHLDVYKRQVLD